MAPSKPGRLFSLGFDLNLVYRHVAHLYGTDQTIAIIPPGVGRQRQRTHVEIASVETAAPDIDDDAGMHAELLRRCVTRPVRRDVLGDLAGIPIISTTVEFDLRQDVSAWPVIGVQGLRPAQYELIRPEIRVTCVEDVFSWFPTDSFEDVFQGRARHAHVGFEG